MARKCVSCGAPRAMTRFENETFGIDHAGLSARVEGLSGWRCGTCGEVEFDADSALRYAAAGDDLVLGHRQPFYFQTDLPQGDRAVESTDARQ